MADRLIVKAGCVATRFVNNVPLKIGGAFKAGEEIGVVQGWRSDGAGPTIRYFKVFNKASLTATGDPLAMKYAKYMKPHHVMWSTTEKEMPQRNVTGPAHISPKDLFCEKYARSGQHFTAVAIVTEHPSEDGTGTSYDFHEIVEGTAYER